MKTARSCSKSRQSEKASLACTAGLRSKIEHLMEDKTYEGGEALRDCLYGLAVTDSKRKEIVNALFSKKELKEALERAERDLDEACEGAGGYARYMDGVRERLSRFETIFPRGSWGWAYGVDHEDLVDERNQCVHTGDRNKAVNAALTRVRAIYGAAVYGDPYCITRSDRYLSQIEARLAYA